MGFVPALVEARGGRLYDDKNPNSAEEWGFHGRGISMTFNGGGDLRDGVRVGDK
jgi:hypothetical protein